MYIPGKIPFVKKLYINVIPTDVEIKIDGVVLYGSDGTYEFIDESEKMEHVLSVSKPVDGLYIEKVSVAHLIDGNQLKFSVPIYRWLLSVVDNK